MLKINQALIKFVMNQHGKLRKYYDDQIDEVHERLALHEKEFSRKVRKVAE
jgi:hypothetical protein